MGSVEALRRLEGRRRDLAARLTARDDDWSNMSTDNEPAEVAAARTALGDAVAQLPASSEQLGSLSTAFDATRIAMVDSLGPWDAAGIWGIDGSLSPEAWLVADGGYSRAEATSLIAVARLCHRFPAAADALHGRLTLPADEDLNAEMGRLRDAGPLRLSFAQLLIWARVVTSARAVLFVEYATHMLAVCAPLNQADTSITAKRWAAIIDDLLNLGEPNHYDRRGVKLSRHDDGMISVSGLLDPHNGELLAEALNSMDRLDPTDTPGGARTRPQRYADHVGEMARRVLGRVDQPDSGTVASPAHTVIVMCNAADGGVGETAEGNVVTADLTDLYTCTAWHSRLRFNEDGEILDISRRARLFTGAQTKAITARDRHCQYPGCDRPPSWCDIHHIHEWQHDGETNIANGVLICHQHHRLLHTRRWTLERNNDHRWRVNRWPQQPHHHPGN